MQDIESAKPPYFSSVWLRLRRHWLSAILFLLPLMLYIFGSVVLHLNEVFQHIMLTLSAVMGIHVLDRMFLVADTQVALDGLIQDVRGDIKKQNQSLMGTSRSLTSMDRCGILEIFASRAEAAQDIGTDLERPDNSKLLLMGVSLNDFVLGMDPALHLTWEKIQSYVRGTQRINDSKRGLDIKVLLIDPYCFGAKLRVESESEEDTNAQGKRLKEEVEAAARHMNKLMQASNPKTTGVHFSARLYRLPPIMFLCLTDSICYVQQYHFWSSRNNKTPIPIFKIRKLDGSPSTYPYHSEMEHHFQWIWKHASVSLSDYLQGHEIGTDQGTQLTSAMNVYTNPEQGNDRMVYLLDRVTSPDQSTPPDQPVPKVSIQGISLASFFKPGELRNSISNLLERGQIPVEILLLDPMSDQAKYRSYREYLFVSKDLTYEVYLAQGEHEKSELWNDTERTIKNIKQIIDDIRNRKKQEGKEWEPQISVSLYSSAPSCFILRIANHVFVEQYHYGKITHDNRRAVLGKDMPLFEYSRRHVPLYQDEAIALSLRQPFALLENHFKHVLAQSRPIPI